MKAVCVEKSTVVDDATTAHAELTAAGVEFVTEPRDVLTHHGQGRLEDVRQREVVEPDQGDPV